MLSRHGQHAIALLLLAALASCATAPRETAPPTEVRQKVPPPLAAEPEPLPPVLPDYAAMRLVIAATGDIMLGTDFPDNRLPDDDGESFLRAVTPTLAAADIAFGNLEGVLMDGGQAEKKCQNPAACYLFRSPTRYAAHLRNAGFDVMSLANNHARDFGEAGRSSSMYALRQTGIHHSGREGDVASWESGELRIAMIAFSPTKESWPLLEIDVAVAEVTRLAEKHDIVIVSFHGGAEGFAGAERIGFGMEYAYGEQRGDVVKFSRAVVDAGADLVLGHGPHVPRAMEIYRDRLIAYSLGNFATYYGISVNGAKGFAPILLTELNGLGELQGGEVKSFIQLRPGGPVPDADQKALQMIRELTKLDFPDGELSFSDSGQLLRLAPATTP